MLAWVMESVDNCGNADDVLIATSEETSDNPIFEFARDNHWNCFRGSLTDVAGRFLNAARKNSTDVIARVCGDSPLMDFRVIDQAIDLFYQANCDLVSNVVNRTFPAGVSVEVFATDTLEFALKKMTNATDREHVTPWLYRNNLHIRSMENDYDLSHVRLTVDTLEDYEITCKLLEQLSRSKHDYTFADFAKLKEKLLSNYSQKRD